MAGHKNDKAEPEKQLRRFCRVFMTDEIILLADEKIDEVNEKIKLIQKTRGLTFGTDAFLLASYVKPRRMGIAAEFGCGTGIISLLVQSKDRFKRVDAYEIQPDFAELAERNIRLNRFEEKICVQCADVTDKSVFDLAGRYDAVFMNPPYMKTTSGKRNVSEAKNIARHEVHGGIADFCASASAILKTGGNLYVVWRPDRLSELVLAMCGAGIPPKSMTFVHADENTPPSIVLVGGKKGSAADMKITPPLILHSPEKSERRVLSEKAAKIYDTMDFYSVYSRFI